jgi:hypothetical protein
MDHSLRILLDEQLGVCLELIKVMDTIVNEAKEITPENKEEKIDRMEEMVSMCSEALADTWKKMDEIK